MVKCNRYGPDFKAKIALAALSGEKTATELSLKFGVRQAQIHCWTKHLKDSAAYVFGGKLGGGEVESKKEPPKPQIQASCLTSEERAFFANIWKEQ